ncbi:hypothetical protein [Flavobacterium sp. UBA6046]|jgi:hypothetical protein|uniref:hypothetical protein n=1 Tax=Flavobacterium sp. UBA6046 TaxID=1946552 RepID=UPI0025BF988F|nr:hypothetical protein [Flavobacterium sp. UBA6046]
MEKLNKSNSKYYDAPTLYLDDLRRIEEILKSSTTDYSLETGDYNFVDIDELLQQRDGDTLTDIEFKSRKPYISINFNKSNSRLYCGDNETTTLGIFHKVDELLSSTVYKRSILFSYLVYFIILIAYFIILIAYFIGQTLFSINAVLSIFLLLVFVIYAITFMYLNINKKKTEVHLYKRQNRRENFFKRNGDAIWVAIIAVILGVVLTIVAGLLLKLYKH